MAAQRTLRNPLTFPALVLFVLGAFTVLIRIEETMSVLEWAWGLVRPLVDWPYSGHVLILVAIAIFVKGLSDIIEREKKTEAKIADIELSRQRQIHDISETIIQRTDVTLSRINAKLDRLIITDHEIESLKQAQPKLRAFSRRPLPTTESYTKMGLQKYAWTDSWHQAEEANAKEGIESFFTQELRAEIADREPYKNFLAPNEGSLSREKDRAAYRAYYKTCLVERQVALLAADRIEEEIRRLIRTTKIS